MLENRKTNLNFEIIDSDEIDTLDTLISFQETFDKPKNKDIDEKFKVIDLNDLAPEIIQNGPTQKTINRKNILSPREVGEQYKKSIENKQNKNSMIEPVDFLTKVQELVDESDRTIQKLKDLQSKCSLGIVDLEHKLEFEELDENEGYDLLLLLKRLSIYKRYIKDTLDKFNSISEVMHILDKSFTQSQLENIDKIEKFHSSRVYTPRVFNIVESKNYPAAKISLNSLEQDIEKLILSTNEQA